MKKIFAKKVKMFFRKRRHVHVACLILLCVVKEENKCAVTSASYKNCRAGFVVTFAIRLSSKKGSYPVENFSANRKSPHGMFSHNIWLSQTA